MEGVNSIKIDCKHKCKYQCIPLYSYYMLIKLFVKKAKKSKKERSDVIISIDA
jgi:hypothetical protein